MRLAFPLILASLFCFSPLAAGQAPLTGMREQARQIDSLRAALGVDLNMFFGKAKGGSYSFLQPTIMAAGRYREVVLETALPFAYLHERNAGADDADRVSIGNPWFALAYLPDCSCGLSRVSLGMAIDAASSSSQLARTGNALARGALGGWDGYLWLDHMLPLVAGVSTRMDLGHKLRLSWDGDVIFGLPAGSRSFELGTQHAGELTLVPSWHWQLGARLSAAWYPMHGGDELQTAFGIYLRHVFVSNAVGARFLMNLDGPHGPPFTRDGMWSLGLFFSTALRG